MPMLFCNIAWMKSYRGIFTHDVPKGGGKDVNESKHAHEVCNFLPCGDFTYGHFETSKKGFDEQVHLENLGASRRDERLEGVDVIWTAPWEGTGRRCVVGWSHDATVFRHRQHFDREPQPCHGFPTEQHRKDNVKTYRVRARSENVTLLPKKMRTLELGLGSGWSGQRLWWYAENSNNPDVPPFLAKVRALMAKVASGTSASSGGNQAGGGGSNGGAAKTPYSFYVERYEAIISPRHHELQSAFIKYLRQSGASQIHPDQSYVDVRYIATDGEPVFVEVKPCDASNLRFAIRTAIGQLLDYQQREAWTGSLLIVVEVPVRDANDLALAHDHGFGLAWPWGENRFVVKWPKL